MSHKKNTQLGMSVSTATNRLKKCIMFNLLEQLDQNYCFRCGHKIEDPESLSVDHKVNWLDSPDPKKLFSDLDNIAFSHLECNITADRSSKGVKHPSHRAYNEGCRCDDCKEIQAQRRRRQRAK